MNQANTICLIAVLYLSGYIGYELCMTNTQLGGWILVGIMAALPLCTYMLGRGWMRGDDSDLTL